MKKNVIFFYFLLLILSLFSQNTNKNQWSVLRGPYPGQEPPGMEPVIFAEKFITSKHRIHGAPAFSPDGKEVYWSVFPRTNEFSTRTQVILF